MIDAEKVIEALKRCTKTFLNKSCDGCPYRIACFDRGTPFKYHVMRDALILLEKQESKQRQLVHVDGKCRCRLCGEEVVPDEAVCYCQRCWDQEGADH